MAPRLAVPTALKPSCAAAGSPEAEPGPPEPEASAAAEAELEANAEALHGEGQQLPSGRLKLQAGDDEASRALCPLARQLLRIALASEPGVQGRRRWREAPDEYLLPFLRFARTRGLDEEATAEEVAAEAVRLLLCFARYVECAEERGALPRALDADRLRATLQCQGVVMLPPSARDASGRRIAWVRLSQLARLSEEAVEDIVCWFFLHASADPALADPGLCLVYDVGEVTLQDAYRMLRMDFPRMMPQGCFPVRIRRVVIVKQPWWVSLLWGAVAGMLSPKLRERVDFAGDASELWRRTDGQSLRCTFGSFKPSEADLEFYLNECFWNGHLLERLQPAAAGAATSRTTTVVL